MEIEQTLQLRKSSVFDRVVLYVGTFFFTMTVILASIQIFVRVVDVGLTLRWTEALARYLLIIGTYFGAAAATRNREHIRINILLNWVEDRYEGAYIALNVCISVAVLIFALIAVYSTARATAGGLHTELPGTNFVTAGMVYAGISVGFLLIVVYELLHLFEEFGNDETVEVRKRNIEGE